MKNVRNTYKFKVLMTLTATFGMLLMAFIYYIHRKQDAAVQHETIASIRATEALLDNELANRTAKMQAVLELIAYDRELQDAFLSKDRDKLLAIAAPIFDSLGAQHSITHFYFSDVDRVNFLRVHQPDRHGDQIKRFTMMEASRSAQTSAGLELGPMGTLTLRSVHPWRRDGKIIGYIELGQEIDASVQTAAGILDNPLFVTINKEYVNQGDWSRGMRMLGRKTSWELLDSSVLVTEMDESSQFDTQTIALHIRSKTSSSSMIGQRHYGKGVIPLRDARQLQVGTIHLLHDITPGVSEARIAIGIATVAGLVISSVVIVFFYVMLSRIDRQLGQTTDQLIEAKAVADAANKAKSEFLANMSHEIRTPLNAVLGFSRRLIRAPLDDSVRTQIEYIAEAGQSLLGLINQILDLSKIEAGKIQIETAALNLHALLRDVIAMMTPLSEEKHLLLDCKIDASVPLQVWGDSTQIRHVLVNLLGNAIKFTEHGRIDMRVHLDDQTEQSITLRIDISDTGIGIPADRQEAVFGAFTQVDGSATREYGGTGLGLAIARQLVRLMGGDLTVQSEIGEGSTFTFTTELTILRNQSEPASDPSELIDLTSIHNTPASPSPPQIVRKVEQQYDKTLPEKSPSDDSMDVSQFRVLYAEDVALNRFLMTEMLNAVGIQVDNVNDGSEALGSLKKSIYDLVLLDLQMPGIDGLETARRIRHREQRMGSSRIPIIAVTASAMKGDRKTVLDAGMDGYITKPVDEDLLYQAIQRHFPNILLQAPDAQAKSADASPTTATPAPPPNDNDSTPEATY